MAAENPVAALYAATVGATKQCLDLIREIQKLNVWAPWMLDLWQHLIPEVFLRCHALEEAFQAKELSASAWNARNLLELAVWVAYCAQSPENAKRFYDDKARDVFDFLEGVKVLASFAGSSSADLQKLADESKGRIVNLVIADGYEAIDEAYLRVHKAAEEIGLGLFFTSLNKIFSKFAHPTAMTIFSFPDEAWRGEICSHLCLLGMTFANSSLAEFERYANSAPRS
ncbi:MAG: hypothetical protein JOZ32_07320 [Bryobacterales bacterium]|nr:hypothetical protein [Bryobacterales bacterium]